MADHYKRLYQGQPVASSAVLLYTVPTDYSAIVMDYEVINVGVDDGEVILWIVPPTETVDDEWIWRPLTTIEVGASIAWEGSKALEADVELWAETFGAALNLIVTGMEVDETPA